MQPTVDDRYVAKLWRIVSLVKATAEDGLPSLNQAAALGYDRVSALAAYVARQRDSYATDRQPFREYRGTVIDSPCYGYTFISR